MTEVVSLRGENSERSALDSALPRFVRSNNNFDDNSDDTSNNNSDNSDDNSNDNSERSALDLALP